MSKATPISSNSYLKSIAMAEYQEPPKGTFAEERLPASITDHPQVYRASGAPIKAVTSAAMAIPYKDWEGTTQTAKAQGRANGINNANLVFGSMPRAAFRRREYATRSMKNEAFPQLYKAILELGIWCDQALSDASPEAHAKLRQESSGIKDEWLIPGTSWTSAIINRTSALPYHKDSGNVKGTYSAMAVARGFCDGGHLHIPEIDTVVRCDDGDVVMFDGASLTHGTTPMELRRKDGWRYTTVFYLRSGMDILGTPQEEVERAKRLRTQREDNFASERGKLQQ